MVSFSYSPSQTGVIVLNYNPVSGKYEGTKECSATSTYRFMYATINKKNKKSIRAFLSDDFPTNSYSIVVNDNCAAGIHEVYADSWERSDDTDEKTCSHNVEMVRRCNICH